jgi:murein DD-endopeptidase MepM/ murein hydrolase activator NlpD
MAMKKIMAYGLAAILGAGCAATKAPQVVRDPVMDPTPVAIVAERIPEQIVPALPDTLPLEDKIKRNLAEAEQRYNEASVLENSGNPEGAKDLFSQSFDALLDARVYAFQDPRYDQHFSTSLDLLFSELNKRLNGHWESPLALTPEEAAMADSIALAEARGDSLRVIDSAGLDPLREGIDSRHTASDSGSYAGLPSSIGERDSLVINENERLVKQYLELFQKEPRRSFIQNSFDRSSSLRELIKEKAKESGLPSELWLLPVVESEYKYKARSPKKAEGLWQFIAPTAMNYGLRINEWLDERRDPVKATVAAMLYLTELYDWYGDWPLALAAYNRGEFGLSKDMGRARIAHFFDLANSNKINKETKDYVPQFYAAVLISRDPEKYGFTIPQSTPIIADTLDISYIVDLALAAKAVGVTEDSLHVLNPELRKWVTPRLDQDNPAYTLKLPKGTKDQFVANISTIEDKTPVDRIKYIVKRGDTLTLIAERNHTNYGKIMEWNHLPNTKIRPGQALFLYKQEKKETARR